ncbi:hypothetical protein [Alkaliflexus imshenetskii]|uniref:hypothetical protein n=1 Tax=Alkaliflexus imshenetskii TaxID=286730 RepID=UPI0004B942D7|nr:hypothetical protein [Alkaliflexus imshenetskii]
MLSFDWIERSQQAGFLGGTLMGVIVNISVADLGVTVVLSAVGAVVSFLVSMAMKRLVNGRKKGAPHQGGENRLTNG